LNDLFFAQCYNGLNETKQFYITLALEIAILYQNNNYFEQCHLDLRVAHMT